MQTFQIIKCKFQQINRIEWNGIAINADEYWSLFSLKNVLMKGKFVIFQQQAVVAIH